MSMEKIPGPIDQTVAARVLAVRDTQAMQNAFQLASDGAQAAMELQVRLSEIPAPTFAEHVRAAEIVRLLKAYGLQDVEIDEVGNVIGKRPGSAPRAPRLAIGAHMDTVFPAGTDVSVRREGNTYYGPGIGDNASGLRCMLETLRCLNAADIQTQGDIWFCATVGEEGLGDICGSKHLFRNNNINRIDGFIAVDNTIMGRILYAAVGSHRWRVTITGPGGHSYSAFGETPSAIHAMCLAGARIAKLKVPDNPRTTFTIGTIQGGTSVNTIAASCSVDIDIRSLDSSELNKAESFILDAFREAVSEENSIWNVQDPAKQLQVNFEAIGNRPAGIRPENCPVLQTSRAALQAIGLELTDYMSSSTDANMPVSIGIPATCLSAGGCQMRTHTINEYYECFDIEQGPQLLMLTAVSLVGMTQPDTGTPILPKL